MNSYVITQNKKYFLKHSKTISLNNVPTDFINIIENGNAKSINIYLYDHNKKKIFGKYKIKDGSICKNENYKSIQLTEPSFRRGIFYNDKNVFEDNSVYKIEKAASDKIVQKLQTINNALRHSILSTTLKKDKFCLKYIDISKDFFVAETEIEIDLQAFGLLVEKYNSLIAKVQSETKDISSFIEIGRAFMNMFLPDKNFNDVFCRGSQVVYLECDEKTSLIPWTIFVHNDAFLSERIIFSYLHLKNHFYPRLSKSAKNTKDIEINDSKIHKMAIVVIENEDLVYALKEADFIIKKFDDKEHVSIDLYNKNLDYLEFINICENYDVLHIITHGSNDGIVLSNDYVLTHQSIKNITNAPQLVFLNTCGTSGKYIYNNKNIISSFLASGVNTVLSSVGKIADDSDNYDFIEQFYQYYMHKYSDVSSAYAYNFATRHSTYSNIRYLFFGIPTIM